jgi:hypothetical protein
VPVQVTKQDDGWYCDYDSKVYPTMVRRYVMLTKCMDGTGELNISIFNEQARSPALPHVHANGARHPLF